MQLKENICFANVMRECRVDSKSFHLNRAVRLKCQVLESAKVLWYPSVVSMRLMTRYGEMWSTMYWRSGIRRERRSYMAPSPKGLS